MIEEEEKSKAPSLDELQLLRAIVALMAEDLTTRQRPENSRPIELVLSDVGLGPADISRMLGKKPNSVAKTISRGRAAGSKSSSQ